MATSRKVFNPKPNRPFARLLAAGFIALCFIAACRLYWIGGAAETDARFRIETVAEGLEVPWSIVFVPDGRILITERPGRLRVIDKDGKLRPEPLLVLPDVASSAEEGLMGLALHPDYSKNKLLYLSYAYARQRGGLAVRVVRCRESAGGLTDRTTIIDDIPAARFHAGCRIRFGPDGKLYITTGDATERQLAQQLDSLAGKTLRLNPDGSIPQDNPFVGRRGARPEIWSYGHRNAQGMDWHPPSGLMFQSEHGPSTFDGPPGGDEINVVEKGKNYGWPIIHHRQERAGMVSPLLEFTPAIAPASGAFYNGSLFPDLRYNFFVGCLRGQQILRLALDPRNPRRVVETEALLRGKYGRIRDVAIGPDGAIYFSTSNRDGRGRPSSKDDRILKILPAKRIRLRQVRAN